MTGRAGSKGQGGKDAGGSRGFAAAQFETSDVDTGVVPGEGGEAATGTATSSDSGSPWASDYDSDSDSSDYSSSGSSVSGTGSLRLEVTLLSIDAVDRVAAAIANRIVAAARKAGLKGVVLGDPGSVGLMRLRSALGGELAALEARLAGVAAGGDGVPGGEDTGFVDLAAAAIAAKGVKSVANNIGAALKVFRVTSAYSGKRDVVRPSALLAALAKHLGQGGLEAQVPRYSVMPAGGQGFLDRALALQGKVQALSASGTSAPEIDSAAQVLDQLLQSMFGGGSDGMRSDSGGQLLQQLSEADMIADALSRGFGLLTVELAATGGSYRAKKWILNALLGRDGLSYSGGAAATYFLMAGDRMAALDSDTIYFASGHGNFHGQETRFSASNIPPAASNK